MPGEVKLATGATTILKPSALRTKSSLNLALAAGAGQEPAAGSIPPLSLGVYRDLTATAPNNYHSSSSGPLAQVYISAAASSRHSPSRCSPCASPGPCVEPHSLAGPSPAVRTARHSSVPTSRRTLISTSTLDASGAERGDGSGHQAHSLLPAIGGGRAGAPAPPSLAIIPCASHAGTHAGGSATSSPSSVPLPSISLSPAQAHAGSDVPVLVTYQHRPDPYSRPARGGTAAGRQAGAASRGGGAAAADGTSTTTSGAGAGATADGAKPGGLVHGLRRFFGMNAEGRAAAAAAAATLEPGDEAAEAGAARVLSPAALARKHAVQQERVNRVRSSLLTDTTARSAQVAAVAAVVEDPEDLKAVLEDRCRFGKSFTEQALSDPKNPMFKHVKKLTKVQESLAHMDEAGWKEKMLESRMMDKPTLLAAGWRV